MTAEAGPSKEKKAAQSIDCSDDDDFQESPPKPKQKVLRKAASKKKRQRATSSGSEQSTLDGKLTANAPDQKPDKKKPRIDSKDEALICRKSKREIKFELANKKRQAKHTAKEEQKKERENARIAQGSKIICSKCNKPGHSRASNKACDFYSPRRKLTTDLKRTFILKTSLKNTCKFPSFTTVLRAAVKHVRDVTYAGSLFANYYIFAPSFETERRPSIFTNFILRPICHTCWSRSKGKFRHQGRLQMFPERSNVVFPSLFSVQRLHDSDL